MFSIRMKFSRVSTNIKPKEEEMQQKEKQSETAKNKSKRNMIKRNHVLKRADDQVKPE